MRIIFNELNDNQLDGLANLCFDLAKASFILAVLPGIKTETDTTSILLKVILGLFWGLASTYAALILLKLKGKIYHESK